MELILETILSLIGFVIGIVCGTIICIGFNNTGSPALLRLTIAFFSIGIGFFTIWIGNITEPFIEFAHFIHIVGTCIQTVGYFFIAFSHTIKSFFPTSRYFRSIAIPLFLISSTNIEHIIRSISFILLIYGSIETIFSCLERKKKTAIFVAIGLSLLALGEFLGWYHFVFPESSLYYISILIKVIALVLLFIPVTKILKIKFSNDANLSN